MKRKFYLVIALFSIASVLIITSCSKDADPIPGGGNGGNTPKDTATLTLPSAPSFPIWNGDNYSFSYSSTNTTGVKINGVVSPSSGTVNLTSLTKDTTLQFETIAESGAVNAPTKSFTIVVFKIRTTNLCKEGKVWKNTYSELLIGGIWTAIVPQCMPTKFYPTGDTCRIYSSMCFPVPDSRGTWYFDNDETHMFYAQFSSDPLWVIEKCTKDSLVLLRGDGQQRRWHVAF